MPKLIRQETKALEILLARLGIPGLDTINRLRTIDELFSRFRTTLGRLTAHQVSDESYWGEVEELRDLRACLGLLTRDTNASAATLAIALDIPKVLAYTLSTGHAPQAMDKYIHQLQLLSGGEGRVLSHPSEAELLEASQTVWFAVQEGQDTKRLFAYLRSENIPFTLDAKILLSAMCMKPYQLPPPVQGAGAS